MHAGDARRVGKGEFKGEIINVLPEASNDGIAFPLVKNHKERFSHLPLFCPVMCGTILKACGLSAKIQPHSV